MAMHTGRRISKEEALLIIAGWQDSASLIKCDCEIAPVAFSMRGHIVDIAGSRRILFLSRDTFSEFAFDLREDFECWYNDPRDSVGEREMFVCGLVFFFRPRPEYASDRDVIALSEIVETS